MARNSLKLKNFIGNEEADSSQSTNPWLPLQQMMGLGVGGTAPLIPAVDQQAVTNTPLARKAQPEVPVAAMSGTHGSLTA